MFNRPLERVWDEDRGSSWQEVGEEPASHELGYMQEASEREIFSYGTETADHVAPDQFEREENDELVAELSQTEGIDGEPLPLEEIAHRNIYGDSETGYDRPLELQRQTDVDAENQRLRAEIERVEREKGAMQYLHDPAIAEQRRAARDQFLDQHGLMTLDDARADRLFGEMAQWQSRTQELENNRVRDSIDAQRAEWGDKAVDVAIAAFQRLDQSSPMARAIDQHVYSAEDPGQVFMSLVHNSDAVASMGRGRWNVQSHAPSRRPSRPSSYNAPQGDNAGFGDEEFERDIANSAWE
jgi:hypothetical protein